MEFERQLMAASDFTLDQVRFFVALSASLLAGFLIRFIPGSKGAPQQMGLNHSAPTHILFVTVLPGTCTFCVLVRTAFVAASSWERTRSFQANVHVTECFCCHHSAHNSCQNNGTAVQRATCSAR